MKCKVLFSFFIWVGKEKHRRDGAKGFLSHRVRARLRTTQRLCSVCQSVFDTPVLRCCEVEQGMWECGNVPFAAIEPLRIGMVLLCGAPERRLHLCAPRPPPPAPLTSALRRFQECTVMACDDMKLVLKKLTRKRRHQV